MKKAPEIRGYGVEIASVNNLYTFNVPMHVQISLAKVDKYVSAVEIIINEKCCNLDIREIEICDCLLHEADKDLIPPTNSCIALRLSSISIVSAFSPGLQRMTLILFVFSSVIVIPPFLFQLKLAQSSD